MINLSDLEEKRNWVWCETLRLHKLAPETRVASSLSAVEIFVALYYSGILKFNPSDCHDEARDRFIISKGHGSISLYPILADLGFFDADELTNICRKGSFLGGIPDPVIPGYETVNGSLGHGLGVGAGMAVGLKAKNSNSKVFVLAGDGELYEGANWEAVMFAAHHSLDNLILIVDCNKVSMLGYTQDIIAHLSLADKFKSFGWLAEEVNGHDISQVYDTLVGLKGNNSGKPAVVIANTIKGKGVPELENNKLSHVMSLRAERVDELIKECGRGK